MEAHRWSSELRAVNAGSSSSCRVCFVAVCVSARGRGATTPEETKSTLPEPSAILDRDYEGEVTTVRSARRDVLAWLSARGADEDARQRAALIVSELATNALQASPGRTYRIRVVLIDENVAMISVRNHAAEFLPPHRERWQLPDRSALGGRGLAIVDSLSEGVTIDRDNGEVVVTARLRL